MKISVITVVYNDKEHIVHTIDSVASQTARDCMEYIVVDGASTDGTSNLIRQHQSQIDVYICEKDSGIYNAMNKGMQHATGDFAIFMNSGDSFCSPDVVERVLNAIGQAPQIPNLIYGDYRTMNGANFSRPIPARRYDKIWYGMVASHQSTFFNLNFLRSQGLQYDESYKIAADYKLALQVIRLSNGNVLQVPICVSNFDVTGVSTLNQNFGLSEANRARREVLGWGWPKEMALTCLQLITRVVRLHGGVIYKILRRL